MFGQYHYQILWDLAQQKQQEFLNEALKAAQVREALTSRPQRHWPQATAWRLGDLLIRFGEWLQVNSHVYPIQNASHSR